jgi:hypothetical protein
MERNPAVVVNLPPETAEEWVAYQTDEGPVTVADDNPAYSGTSKVVVVAFRSELNEWHVDWTPDEKLPTAEAPSDMLYAFPPGRLRKIGQYEPEVTA